MIYNSKDKEFRASYGETLLIGFQQVVTNPDKVFVWVRDTIEKPEYINRHHTTKTMNNTFLRVEWGKSVWKIDAVMKHLNKQLKEVNVTENNLRNLQYNELCDKWKTSNDGLRNFVKAVIKNPYSEVSRARIRIQVTMGITTPQGVYERAYKESGNDITIYNKLLSKYRDRCIVRTYVTKYANIRGMLKPQKKLEPVFVYKEGKENLVYKETEIILGNPVHKFIEYKKRNYEPAENAYDILNKINSYNTTEKQLRLDKS